MNEAPDFLRLQERSGRTSDVLQQRSDFGRMIIDSHVNPRRVSTERNDFRLAPQTYRSFLSMRVDACAEM